jgi:rhodanese-related sulfurtransferase
MAVNEDIEPNALRQRLAAPDILLVDVREADEFAREHIADAASMPLSTFDPAQLPRDRRIIVSCASGRRSQQAAEQLGAAGFSNVANLQGGLAAWKLAGLPTSVDRRQPISLMRQVQITAGTLVVLGTVLGALVSAWFLLLPGIVGGGLLIAGATGSCLMAHMLSKLPYNRSQTTDPHIVSHDERESLV